MEGGPKTVLAALSRLFLRAWQVRYAWRPAATRTKVRETVAAACPPAKTDGAVTSKAVEKTMNTVENRIPQRQPPKKHRFHTHYEPRRTEKTKNKQNKAKR
jgi:hypothetical protein